MTNKIANVGEFTSAQILIGAVCLILIVAALVLAWDGLQALNRYRAGKATPQPKLSV